MPSLGQNLFGSNTPDIDSAETREWLDALGYLGGTPFDRGAEHGLCRRDC